MRKAYQILAYVLAGLVVIQTMSIAYAMAGVFHWVDKDGGVLDSAVYNSWDEERPTFQGSGGYGLHAISGQMLIPVIAIAFLVVSLFAAKQVQGAAKRAAILLGMVILQVVLGLTSHDTVALAPLHALNGLGILGMALASGQKAREAAPAVT